MSVLQPLKQSSARPAYRLRVAPATMLHLKSLVSLAVPLVSSMLLHAQFGGEGKPTNDTATIHSTCAPDGTQTITDDYSGSVYIDHAATKKYMLPIDGARARGEWNEVLRLSDMSIKAAPKCYYAYFSRAQSLLYSCKLPEAKTAMNSFISVASGNQPYEQLVVVAKDLLDSLNSGDAAAHCR